MNAVTSSYWRSIDQTITKSEYTVIGSGKIKRLLNLTKESIVVDKHLTVKLSIWTTTWVPLFAFFLVITVAYYDRAFYAKYFDLESGLIENIQVAVLAVALGYAVSLLRSRRCRVDLWLVCWVIAIGAACLLIIGEELNYGQHVIGWPTPEWLRNLNKQDETNLHNISSWFNEKPRVLLEIVVVLAGIVNPSLKLWRGRGLVDRPWWLLPGPAVLPVAVLSELAMLPDRALYYGLIPADWWALRYSELQELYFFYFILLYLAELRQKCWSNMDVT